MQRRENAAIRPLAGPAGEFLFESARIGCCRHLTILTSACCDFRSSMERGGSPALRACLICSEVCPRAHDGRRRGPVFPKSADAKPARPAVFFCFVFCAGAPNWFVRMWRLSLTGPATDKIPSYSWLDTCTFSILFAGPHPLAGVRRQYLGFI